MVRFNTGIYNNLFKFYQFYVDFVDTIVAYGDSNNATGLTFRVSMFSIVKRYCSEVISLVERVEKYRQQENVMTIKIMFVLKLNNLHS